MSVLELLHFENSFSVKSCAVAKQTPICISCYRWYWDLDDIVDMWHESILIMHVYLVPKPTSNTCNSLKSAIRECESNIVPTEWNENQMWQTTIGRKYVNVSFK